MPTLNELNSETFRAALDTVFEVYATPDARIPLKLINVIQHSEAPRLERFSLTFCGPRTPLLVQRIYCFEHAQLGSQEMFAVPLGPDGDGMLYEVVFNRVRHAGA
jgi:hypothetical protein